MSHVPLVDASDLPESYRYLLDDDVMGELNIFRAMGNNPPVLQGYMRFGSVLWEETGLPATERELVVLVVAKETRSRYEWHQHVGIARDVGVDPARIDAIGRADWASFEGRLNALLSYTRAIVEDRATDDDVAALCEHVDADALVGITLLVGYYVATARALAAWDVPVEDEFVGWVPGAT